MYGTLKEGKRTRKGKTTGQLCSPIKGKTAAFSRIELVKMVVKMEVDPEEKVQKNRNVAIKLIGKLYTQEELSNFSDEQVNNIAFWNGKPVPVLCEVVKTWLKDHDLVFIKK